MISPRCAHIRHTYRYGSSYGARPSPARTIHEHSAISLFVMLVNNHAQRCSPYSIWVPHILLLTHHARTAQPVQRAAVKRNRFEITFNSARRRAHEIASRIRRRRKLRFVVRRALHNQHGAAAFARVRTNRFFFTRAQSENPHTSSWTSSCISW